MRFILFSLICVLSLSGQNLFGQAIESSSKSRIASQTDEIQRRRSRLNRIETEIKQKEERVDLLISQADGLRRQIESLCSFEQPNDCPEGTRNRIARLRTQENRLRREIDAIESELLEVNDIVAQNFLRLDDARKALQDEIRTRKVHDDFFSLVRSSDQIDEILDNVEEMYDRSIMGQYLQNKITQLLNSRVICDAHSRCSNRGDAIPHSQVQGELFPTTRDIQRGPRLRRNSGTR